MELSELKYDANGLIPVVVQDYYSKKVLTVAYMNEKTLATSIAKGLTCFWSRSRQTEWLKGETSGNYQHIVSITSDCDNDALVIEVVKDGPACHTGSDSCFTNVICETGYKNPFSFDMLYDLIKGRKSEKKEGSYTTYLFEKGLDKILKKVGEECTEVIIGSKNSREEAIYEISDLAYHVLVLMVELGISLEDIKEELAKRHVVDKKVKQEKMQ